MIALDTECTGLDTFHGAKPYMVTTCLDDGTQRFWEWEVDRFTREVLPPEEDIEEVRQLIHDADRLVLQNGKFDDLALATIGIEDFPWWKTEDTLVASHVLASDRERNLTALVRDYLWDDIRPFEDNLQKATIKCRGRVQQARLARKRGKPKDDDDLVEWAIAEEGRADMPSAGKEFWKADGWLPRVMAERDGLPVPKDNCEHQWAEWSCVRCRGHRYWQVLKEYANADSAATLLVWREMEAELQRRGHWKLYRKRMEAVPVLIGMENRGAAVSVPELESLKADCSRESNRLAQICYGIALGRGYDLQLPKGGRNGSLDEFVFDVLGLEKVYNPKAKTDRPAFDAKIAIPYYLDTLPPGSQALEFVKAFVAKGGKDKAVGYLDDYKAFGVPLSPNWIVLHTTFNAAGTKLLRRSSSNPNLQQVGKKKEQNLRRCFGPAPGREWWSVDYKNIELRIPAYEANERELIALFERASEPPYYGSEHLLNFSTVYPDIWEDAIKRFGPEKAGAWIKSSDGYADTWYQWCKNGDFAVGYGAIDRPDGLGTADRTFRRPGSHARLKSRFAKKEAHNQWCIAFATEHGYIETIPDRDVDPQHGYPLLCTRTDYGEILPTVPLNFRTQGTAGWCTLKAMLRCDPKLKEWSRADPRGYYQILEVHDELVFDFPAGAGREPWRTNLPKILELAALMEKSGDDIGIPLPVDIEYHARNWGDGVAITSEMKKPRPKPKLVRREYASVS